MPTTDYKRDERLHIIHMCLKNRRVNWSVHKLAEKVFQNLELSEGRSVSKRTIAEDLKYLEFKKGAPIKRIYKGREVFYVYEDEFELNEPVIDKDQYLSLILTNQIIGQFQGFSLTEDLEKVILKLQHQIEEHEQPKHDLILFENADKLKNVNFLQHLFEAIAEKTVLKIDYRLFNSDKSFEKIIHPYFLKQYNNRWFLFGYDEINNRLDNSPIDRIESFKPITQEFLENIQFSPKEYFKNMIGVTRFVDSKTEKIIFSVSKSRVDYFITKPVHTSQTEIKKYKNGWTDFSIEVIINKELFGLFLSFGPDIVVKSPKKLKNEFKRLLQKIFENYK